MNNSQLAKQALWEAQQRPKPTKLVVWRPFFLLALLQATLFYYTIIQLKSLEKALELDNSNLGAVASEILAIRAITQHTNQLVLGDRPPERLYHAVPEVENE